MPIPHDELFRRIFGRTEAARELLRVALPPAIVRRLDLASLRVSPGSYIDRRLRPSQSDLLLETTSRGRDPALIYILFEHKSSAERGAPYQLLRYMVGIWDEWTSRKENRNWRQLPPIIPVVFSHAPQRWSYPLEFSRLVRGPRGLDLRELTPSFSAIVLDLAGRDERELGADRLVNGLLRIFKHTKAGPSAELAKALADVARLGRSGLAPGLVEAIVAYLFRARQGRSARGILEALPEGEMRRGAMTIAEALERKGEKKGRAEGERRGRIQGKQEILARLLGQKTGLTERERKAIRSCTNADKLDAAIDAIVTARSKGGVLRHLQ